MLHLCVYIEKSKATHDVDVISVVENVSQNQEWIQEKNYNMKFLKMIDFAWIFKNELMPLLKSSYLLFYDPMKNFIVSWVEFCWWHWCVMQLKSQQTRRSSNLHSIFRVLSTKNLTLTIKSGILRACNAVGDFQGFSATKINSLWSSCRFIFF